MIQLNDCPRCEGSPGMRQRCTISIFRYRFNINYSVSLLINTNFNFNYSKEGLTISIPYQFFNKFPYQFQYQLLLSMPPMILIRLPISYQLVIVININNDINYQNRLLSISILLFFLINICLSMHCAPLMLRFKVFIFYFNWVGRSGETLVDQ